MKLLVFAFLFICLKWTSADTELNHLTISDYENYFFRDQTTSAQIVLTSSSAPSKIQPRFLVAFPAGDSGVAVFLRPTAGQIVKIKLDLVDGSLQSLTGGNIGVRGQFQLNEDSSVGNIVMGSARTIRDFTDSGKATVGVKAPLIKRPTANQVVISYIFIDNSATISLTLQTTNTITIDPKKNNAITKLPAGVYDFSVSDSRFFLFTYP